MPNKTKTVLTKIKTCLFAAGLLSCFFLTYAKSSRSVSCGDVLWVNSDYSRTSSRFFIRSISVPTRANLDFAAYAENIMFYDSTAQSPIAPKGITSLSRLHFGHALDSATLTNELSGTPLSREEICLPMMWAALREYLLHWDFEKSQSLVETGNRIAEETWGNDEIQQPIQELTRVYLRKGPGGWELWGKVEFKPWAKSMFPFLRDGDKDGFPNFFGRLHTKGLGREVFERIAGDYRTTKLDYEGIVTWGNELASFWYPTYNTDITASDPTQWKSSTDDMAIARQVQKWTSAKPAVVIRGKPFGISLFNIFLVDGIAPPSAEGKVEVTTGPAMPASSTDLSGTQNAIRVIQNKLLEECKTFGQNDFKKWNGQSAPFQKFVQGKLSAAPVEVQGIVGNDDWIFLRRSLDYLVAGDLSAQRPGKNPVPVIVAMKRKLQILGIDFLFIPIPPKPEIYPEKLGPDSWTGLGPYVNPYSRKFMTDLADSGVETIDVLNAFLTEKKRTCPDCEALYQKQDTHWTRRGLELTAGLIAKRIKEYKWAASLSPKVALTVKPVTFQRTGDIVSRLPMGLQTHYRPQTLSANQVLLPDGTLYKDQKTSAILVLGDSYCGVYQRTDCKHAGVSAHIAKELQYPVHLVMSYSGGPTVIAQLKSGDLQGKKLVVWMMTARDLNDYWEDWKNPEF
jgi:alginate O-acetyltransferase complex protein AlgJ